MTENGQEVGKTQREPSDGDAALTLSEGERKGRSSRRKCLRLPCRAKESVAKPLRSPWAKVIHQKSITYPRKKPVLKPLLCSVTGQEKPVESEAWEWRLMRFRTQQRGWWWITLPPVRDLRNDSHGHIRSWTSTTYRWRRMILQSKKRKEK